MSQKLAPKDERAEYIEGLRLIADWLAAHPEVPLPYIKTGVHRSGREFRPTLAIYLNGGRQREEMAAIVRAMGSAHKSVHDGTAQFYAWRSFAGIDVFVAADRAEVCERVVLATEEVTETVPDPEALAAVPTVEVTRTVETVEWRCSPLLATEVAA